MTRIAESLLVLGGEVLDLSPLTTLYYYDDTEHVDSDHDPNPAGVVCALDIMAGHGLDLQWLADEILKRRNPDLKYVIYNRRIASARTGWKWAPYSGSNPHTDHVHVSVGVGPDGYSRQPYDDTERWLDMGDIFCEKGNKGPAVRSLQLGLNRIWKGHPEYNGKDIVTVTDVYDALTCKAVYKLLAGPVAGDKFHPELYWRLMDQHAALYAGKAGPQGVQGDKGDPGDAAVLQVGDLLRIEKE
jgi:hypothetical protein